jgi:hypothetical protein
MTIDYAEHFNRTGDPYGTIHPEWKPRIGIGKPRFSLYVREVRTDTPPEYSHELMLVDRKYQDSDGFPIDAIASGASWVEAFKLAGEWVDQALSTDRCIF